MNHNEKRVCLYPVFADSPIKSQLKREAQLVNNEQQTVERIEECRRQLEMRGEMPFCNGYFILTSLSFNWKFCNIRYVVFIL